MKNKKIIIISGIFAIIIAIAVILVALYFTTDLFKTNQQLFYKYISQVKVIDTNYLKQCEIANEKITKNSSSSVAEVSVATINENQETDINKPKTYFNIKSNGLENVLLNQSYRDFIFSNSGENFLTVKYLRDGNTYGIIADNVLAKYLAVENSNLKEFFSKLGVSDISKIPNKIPNNYEEIFNIDKQTLESIMQTYSTIIYNNIDSTHFYKTKNNDKTITFGVSLSEQEIANISKKILVNAKNDNVLLNLITTKAIQLGYDNITVANVQAKITDYISKIESNSYASDKDYMKISIIKKNKDIVKIEFEVNYEKEEQNASSLNAPVGEKANVKSIINIDISNQNEIVITSKENDIELGSIRINYQYNESNIAINTSVKAKEDGEISNSIEIQYQINNYQTDNIEQKLAVYTKQSEGEDYQINLTNNISLKQDVQISKLTTDNSAKLNAMSSEELSQLFMAIVARVNSLYGDEIFNSINI